MWSANAMKVKVLVTKSCPTLCNPMDCSPPGSSAHGDSPGKNTRVGCHFLLPDIFLIQGLNPCLLRFLHTLADSHCATWKAYKWQKFPSIPSLMRVFNHKLLLDFVKCFFCVNQYNHIIFFTWYDGLHWLTWMLKQPCTPAKKSTSSQCIVLFIHCKI